MAPEAFQRIQKRKRVSLLLNDLRTSTGSNYGYFLYRQGVIPGLRYVQWFGNARSEIIAWGVTLAVALLLAAGCYAAYKSVTLKTWYYQWRFTKINNSDLDRFRSRNYLMGHAVDAPAAIAPMLGVLHYKGCSVPVAEDVLRLVVDSHVQKFE